MHCLPTDLPLAKGRPNGRLGWALDAQYVLSYSRFYERHVALFPSPFPLELDFVKKSIWENQETAVAAYVEGHAEDDQAEYRPWSAFLCMLLELLFELEYCEMAGIFSAKERIAADIGWNILDNMCQVLGTTVKEVRACPGVADQFGDFIEIAIECPQDASNFTFLYGIAFNAHA